MLVLLAACGGGAPPDLPSRPNLVLVTLDTTRADRLGCYGRTNAGTPTFDRLAREGAVVEHAIAVAPLTLPSHASILTGLYPPRHGIRDNMDFRLPDAETTLAEHLQARGYATAAAVGAHVLTASLGLSQGFESYTEPKGRAPAGGEAGRATGIRFVEVLERRAGAVIDDALVALDRIDQGPFLLWVHLFDPHVGYDPPEPQRSAFPDDPYQGEIAYTDAEVGRLIAELERRGIAGRTIVAVTADHGESLGEHGESTHSLFVYDATIRVPLIVRYPGVVPAGSRYGGLVSGVDLAPTLLELMGLPPLPRIQGVSHATALRGKGPAPAREPVYAESLYPERTYGWAPVEALRSLDDKFIEAPEPEYYDLAADPHETRNLAADRPEAVLDGKRRLLAALQRFGRPDPAAEALMTAEQRADLESLGYVSAPGGSAPRKSRPDPKRLVAVHDKYVLAKSLVASGDLGRVERLVDEILALDPDNPGAIALRGTVAFQLGRRDSGIDALRSAVQRSPTVFEPWWNLATALHEAGRIDDAVAAYRSAVAIQPGSGGAWHGLGNALLARGDPKEAVVAFDRALKTARATPALLASIGAALDAAGEPARAERALAEAVARDPSLAAAWNKLGVLAEKAGRRPEARERYDRALAANPALADALFNRAKLALIERRFDDAARDAAALTGAHPGYAAGWFVRGQAAAGRGDGAGARIALERYLATPGPDPRLAAAARDLLRQIGN